MTRKKLGIIGCGNIGSALVRTAAGEMAGRISEIILRDIDPQKTALLEKELSVARAASDAEEVMETADLIIEAVSPSLARELVKKAVRKKKDILVMSVGGMLDNMELLQEARRKAVRILLPSGAVSGIDALKAARIGGIDSVTLTTRKPPASVKDAPYLAEKGIDIMSVAKKTVIFEGNAASAVKAFPRNINVSALLSIAGIGAQRTGVRIIVSPEYKTNIHEIEIKGISGTIITRTENIPSPENPKTSYLAVLSAIAALREYFDTVRVGT